MLSDKDRKAFNEEEFDLNMRIYQEYMSKSTIAVSRIVLSGSVMVVIILFTIFIDPKENCCAQFSNQIKLMLVIFITSFFLELFAIKFLSRGLSIRHRLFAQRENKHGLTRSEVESSGGMYFFLAEIFSIPSFYVFILGLFYLAWFIFNIS